ncbi:MAG: CAP domain-containing protein [Patescibacteria group bacterium]
MRFLIIYILFALSVPLGAHAAISDNVRGMILLQVEEHGEAWYVNPTNNRRYYMKNGAVAYEMMRSFGLGITDADLQRIPLSITTEAIRNASSICSSNPLANRLKGRILLQVQQHGEAYYVYPKNCRMIYMKDGNAAYEIMRYLGLGITNFDLQKISLAEGEVDIMTDPAVTNPSNPSKPTAGNDTGEYKTVELKTLDVVNDHRESIGVERLAWSDAIAEQARIHSQNMANGDVAIGHGGFEDRIDVISLSYPGYNGAAENLAWNYDDDPAQTALDWWLTSAGHKVSLENNFYDLTGIGVAKVPDGPYFITQIFLNID